MDSKTPGKTSGKVPSPTCLAPGINYAARMLFTGGVFFRTDFTFMDYLSMLFGDFQRAYEALLAKVANNTAAMCRGCIPPCSCVPVPISFPLPFVTSSLGPRSLPIMKANISQEWAPYCY